MQQADKLAERIFCNVDKLAIGYFYFSDLPRTMQTALIIADQLALPIIPLEQFREVDNGKMAGMSNTLRRYPGLF